MTDHDGELSELDDDRAEAARRHRLPLELAKRIEGSSWDEINSDAKRLAALLAKEPEPEQDGNGHNESDRPIEADLGNLIRNAAEYKAAWNRALVDMAHPPKEEGDED